MKVPDPRLNFIMSILRSISRARVGELARGCGDGLIAIGNPLAAKVKVILPGLDDETFTSGRERNLLSLDKALSDYGLIKGSSTGNIPSFISIALDDGHAIAIGIIKHLGNYSGYLAAFGDDLGPEGITLTEATWLYTSQLSLRVHTLLSPGYAGSIEILGRRILRILAENGVRAITIGSTLGQAPWLSLYRVSGSGTISKEVERLPQDQVAGINNGEMIGENTMKYLWAGHEIAMGIWIASDAGYYLAIGFDDRKLPGPEIINKIHDQIEAAARNDYEYLIKSFDKLRSDFDKLVKSERAAAVTETSVTINHEINNPLTAILGNIQLLLMSKDKLPTDIVAKLETVERSAAKIRETTAKLMSIIEPVTTPYVSGLEMIDIEKSKKKESK